MRPGGCFDDLLAIGEPTEHEHLPLTAGSGNGK
jgi:hypothetical protein